MKKNKTQVIKTEKSHITITKYYVSIATADSISVEKIENPEEVTTKSKIEEFLEFRKQFTKRQWKDISHAIEIMEQEKADQVQLDDSDIKIIEDRLSAIL